MNPFGLALLIIGGVYVGFSLFSVIFNAVLKYKRRKKVDAVSCNKQDDSEYIISVEEDNGNS